MSKEHLELWHIEVVTYKHPLRKGKKLTVAAFEEFFSDEDALSRRCTVLSLLYYGYIVYRYKEENKDA